MEHETPGEHWALRDPKQVQPIGPGWQIRIVPNRYLQWIGLGLRPQLRRAN